MSRFTRFFPIEYRGFTITRVKHFSGGRLHCCPWLFKFSSKDGAITGKRASVSEAKSAIDTILISKGDGK